jgi:YidC/Oxa1 family membrane protein insertase
MGHGSWVGQGLAGFAFALIAFLTQSAAFADQPVPVDPASGEKVETFRNDGFFEADISTWGGAVRSFRLLKEQFAQKDRDPPPGPIQPPAYKLQAGPLDLVSTWSAGYFPFGLAFEDVKGQPQVTRTLQADASHAQRTGDWWALFAQDPVFTVVERTPTSVTMVWPDPKTDVSTLFIERTWTVAGNYVLAGTARLLNLGATEVSGRPWLQLVGWEPPSSGGGGSCGGMFGVMPDLKQVVCGVGDGIEKVDRPTMVGKDWAPAKSGRVGFAGVSSRYFLVAVLPQGDAVAQCAGYGNASGTLTAAMRLADPERDGFLLRSGADACLPAWLPATGQFEGRRACAAGEWPKGASRAYQFTAFLGPKDFDELKSMDANLDDTIDFWVLGFLAKPMLWLMRFSYSIIPSWALSIIFLTVVVKLLTLYWSHKSMVQMRRMQQLKPKMDELRDRFKDDKQKLNQAMMDLYKREKVNPLGGCLPMLLQMPIWIALYRTIYGAVDLYQAPLFLWITDLSAHDPWFVMPILLGALMWVQQKMTPQAGDPTQAKIMLWMMPIMFTSFMLFLPSGLVFYILVNTVTSIAQQWWMNRTIPAVAPARK